MLIKTLRKEVNEQKNVCLCPLCEGHFQSKCSRKTANSIDFIDCPLCKGVCFKEVGLRHFLYNSFGTYQRVQLMVYLLDSRTHYVALLLYVQKQLEPFTAQKFRTG